MGNRRVTIAACNHCGLGGALHQLVHTFQDRRNGWESNQIETHFQAAKAKNPNAKDKFPHCTALYLQLNAQEVFATFAQAYFTSICAFPYESETLERGDPKSFNFIRCTFGDL